MENDRVLCNVFSLLSEASVSNPIEVIIVLTSLCISILFHSTSHSSDHNLHRLTQNNFSVVYFNSTFIMLFRCLAFVCIFVQCRRLEKVKSKLILISSVLATLVSSVLFNKFLMSWFQFEIPNNIFLILDIIIYTLLIIDLKKCNLILNNALETSNMNEARQNIVRSIAQFASRSTLDTFFLILLVALGNLSDSRDIKSFSSFSCILLASNFVIFVTVYPALLSLMIQFKNNDMDSFVDQSSNAKLTKSSKVDMELRNNPGLVYVKILMTIFLFLIHLKLMFFNSNRQSDFNLKDKRNNSNKLTEDEEYFDLSKEQNQIIFYTPLCLLATLVIYFLIDKRSKSQADLKPQAKAKLTRSISTQTTCVETNEPEINNTYPVDAETRSIEQCLEVYNKNNRFLDALTDQEVINMIAGKHISIYKLESYFSNQTRAVSIRRKQLEEKIRMGLDKVPFDSYNYTKVTGSCCENVIGYVPVPLGYVGPLKIDGKIYYIPMATTEGTLIASTNRGCSALSSGKGVSTVILKDGMTRGPVIRFLSAMRAAQVKEWLEEEENFQTIKVAFDSTSRFGKLTSIKCCVAGRELFMRLSAKTGDAMGMNMLSKGTEKALIEIKKYFPDAEIISLSGNYCTDKKPSAINWIEGRGKSVVCEAVIKADIVKSTLKTSVQALCDLNSSKNLIGSALAGSIGGFNAHAANIVSATYIACGQDPAQVVEGSNCLTCIEPYGPDGSDLYISCRMPSLEVGTVGGGTLLEAQSGCLRMLGVDGPNQENPGENASQLARIIASTVMAGELSLMSALASGHLVNSHMRYNRSTAVLNQQASSFSHNLL